MLRRFKAAVAPLKAAVFPLVQQPELNATARSISAALTRAGLANTVDTTGEIHFLDLSPWLKC